MQKEKIFPIIIAMLFLLPAAMAANVFAPQKISSNLNWTFSVTLDSTDSFSTTEVFLDGKKIVTAYSNGQTAKDPIYGKFVLDAFVFDEDPTSASGLTLYVSYFGLPKGTYQITTTTFQGSAVKSQTDPISLEVFNPASEEIENTLTEKIDSATAGKEELTAQINSLQESMAAKDQEISALRTELQEQVQQKISQTESNLTDLQNQVTSDSSRLGNELSELNGKVGIIEEEVFPDPDKNPNPLVGLATFAGERWLGLFLMFIAAVITVVMVSHGGKLSAPTSMYSDFESKRRSDDNTEIVEGLDLENKGNDFSGKQIATDDDDYTIAKKGKWAAK